THEGLVHYVVDPVGLAGVSTEEAGRDLSDPSANAVCVRGNVGRAEGRALTPPLSAVVAGDPDDRGIERGIGSTARQSVHAARVRQVDAEKLNLRDLHVVPLFEIRARSAGGMRTSLPTCLLLRNSCCARTISQSG